MWQDRATKSRLPATKKDEAGATKTSLLAGIGDFCRYAATPMIELISAAAAAMRIVSCIPDCRLKCCGSIPTAANPVRIPPAPPLTAAATMPFSHISTFHVFAGFSVTSAARLNS